MATTADTASGEESARVARAYFEELERGDVEAPLRHYAPDGTAEMSGRLAPGSGRERVAQMFRELASAVPDWKLEILDITGEEDRAAVRWRITGTFAGPGELDGFQATGARVDFKGVDVVWVRDGQIARLEAYADNMTIARQLGLFPPQASPAERRMTTALNARTRMARRVAGGEAERVADGVWLVRGGFPMKTMNVYLIEDEGGVTVFDAGIRSMVPALAAAAAGLGGIRRVVLGHAHADHRGAAPGLGAPVYCHPADRADAEADGGEHYFEFSKLSWFARPVFPHLLRAWDGGPVAIEGTVEEGEEVAGFRVVHLPGHAPGLIGLWREADRVALTSDCFYTLDPQTGRKGGPRVPHGAFNQDTEQARASMRKLAEMEPAAAWPGHADPVVGDVRSALEHAAATT
jgi:steroid delta-isomerase-like uncharacterized protein